MVDTSPSPWMHNPQLDGDPFLIGSGTAGVLLFHGFTATTTEVRPMSDRLASAGLVVSGPLLPGHGTTPQELNSCRWQDWIAAAEHELSSLQSHCNQVWVGGESLGGLVALFLAANHPEIQGCMLYAPAMNIRGIRFSRLVAPFRSTMPKKPSRDGLPWKGYNVYPVRAAIQLARLQGELKCLIPKIKTPLLILQGRLDHTVRLEGSQYIYDHIGSTHKELYWMDNSPHCILLASEVDQAFQLTLRFIQSTALHPENITPRTNST